MLIRGQDTRRFVLGGKEFLLTFEEWCGSVDRELQRIVGLDAVDLPDVDYYMMWDAQRSPFFAARAAINEAMPYPEVIE